jgi:hypothetical protein
MHDPATLTFIFGVIVVAVNMVVAAINNARFSKLEIEIAKLKIILQFVGARLGFPRDDLTHPGE